MKVLLINNFLCNSGGAENSTFRIAEILQKNNHQVYFFATNKNPLPDIDYKQYFPEYINYSKLSFAQRLIYIYRPIFNFEAKHKLSLLLKEIKPDIVHCNCISYSLTSSVILACKKYNIPVVMTLRDAYYMCPAIHLLQKSEYYCKNELCVKGNALYCVLNRCFNKSLTKSSIAFIEFYFRKLFKTFNYVSYYICPTQVMYNLAQRSGINKNQLALIHNIVSEDYLNIKPDNSCAKYFLYAGRLSKEKNIETLLFAFALLPSEIQLHIAGNGQNEASLKQLAQKLKLTNITFTGFKTDQELYNEYKSCIATIIPSNYFETFGLSIIESFACRKPVIGSNIGAIPELIDHNENGIIFEPQNHKQLADAILYLYNNLDLASDMGLKGRIKLESKYNQKLFYSKLINVYKSSLYQTRKTS